MHFRFLPGSVQEGNERFLLFTVLCKARSVQPEVSVIRASGHGQFLDLPRTDLSGGFLILNTTFPFIGQHPAVCCVAVA